MLKIAFTKQLWSGIQGAYKNPVNPVFHPVNAAVNGVVQKGEQAAGGMFEKFAPYLALPVAFGLAGSLGGGQGNVAQGAPAPTGLQSMQPNFIQPLNPQGFKSAGLLSNTVYATQNRAIANLVDRKMRTQDTENKPEAPKTTVKARKHEDSALIGQPKVQDYIRDLIEN